MYELTRRWVKAGHQVTVVTAPYEKSDIRADGFISRMNIEGVQLIIINSSDSNRNSVLKRAFSALRFALVSCKIALTHPCDMVLASSGPITVGIPALLAKWFRGKKMIFEIRDLWPQGAIELKKIKGAFIIKLALWFEKLCYKNASLIVACSEGMESSVIKRFGKLNTLIITNASDPELFRGPDKNNFVLPDKFSGKSVFLYAGSLGFMDHGHLMIDAMKLITDPNICLVILGDGAERSELEHRVIHEKINNVHFLGLLPKHRVAGWMHVCVASIIVFKNFPVLQTSSPNKMFDAFAAGVPIIHNTSGWIRDLVQKESCGISIGPEDAEGMANAVLQLASDKKTRDQFALNAARLADSLFNRDQLAVKYLDRMLELQ